MSLHLRSMDLFGWGGRLGGLFAACDTWRHDWRAVWEWDGWKVYVRDHSAKPPAVGSHSVCSIPKRIAVHIKPRVPPIINRVGR